MHEIIISTHIPKTAGTTLKNILQTVYEDSFIWVQNTHHPGEIANTLKNIDLYNIKVIHGHVSYGLHEYLPNDINYKYITFLRHPGERLLSLYNFIFREDTANIYKWDIKYNWSRDIGFFEWLHDVKIAGQDNGMTRFLSGMNVLNTYDITNKVTKDNYNLAEKNLAKYSFVGLTEFFDFGILELAHALNWDDIPEYEDMYVYPDRLHFKDLTSSEMSEVQESQKFDFYLYTTSTFFAR